MLLYLKKFRERAILALIRDETSTMNRIYIFSIEISRSLAVIMKFQNDAPLTAPVLNFDHHFCGCWDIRYCALYD